jgi:hypothetical protein
MLVAALLENLWLVLKWAGATCPRSSHSRRFDWIRHELKEELHRRWKIKANGVGVPASRATAAG